MFKDRGHGHIDISDNAFGFVYRCYLPKVGYGINSVTYKMEETDILPASENPLEHIWIRPELGADFKVRRAKEKKVQAIDPYYVDEYLEGIRKREWKRRLLGVWFWNYNPITKKSILEYITGLNYFYITHWKFQGKLMDFRIADRDIFYVIAYDMEDDKCLGPNEITKRKNGKTARMGCWAYERVSRTNYHHAGLQSKSDTDAEEAFKKAIIHPWQKLPDFFRPRYDLMKGEEPNELRFFATARRGSKVEEEDDSIEEPLESFFDYKVSTESAYDGPEVHTYCSEEAGKTKKPVSIKERQNVVRFCTEIDFELKGKHFYTSTVEPEKNEEENYEFQELTANSNPLERDENGFTGTGLYTYFLPAQKGMYINKEYARYGYVDETMNLEFLANKIKALEEKNDTRGVSSFKRKNPRNLKEAFSADGEFALYDPELINEQLDSISWGQPVTERFDLDWKDGFEFERPVINANGETEYVVNELIDVIKLDGKYERVIGWQPKEPNKVVKINGCFKPNNNFAHRVGCDPFKYDKTKDKRRSKAAAFLYQIKDDLYPNDPYNDTATVKYVLRAAGTKESDMDVLKLVWWAGCQVLFERNVNHWKDNFASWDCSNFLMWLPGEVEPGIYTDGANTVVQMVCNYTESYINEHIKKVRFKSLMRKDTGWLGFKVEETQNFDEPMGFGFTLIAVKGKKYIKVQDKQIDVESLIPYHKAG
jgi:hypothetical protein